MSKISRIQTGLFLLIVFFFGITKAHSATVIDNTVPVNDPIVSNYATTILNINRSVTTLTTPLSTSLPSAELVRIQNQIRSQLKDRKGLMTKLARLNPSLFLRLVLSVKTQTQVQSYIPTDYTSLVEQTVSGDSTVDVFHVDDFSNPQKSHFDYYIKPTNGTLNTILASSPTTPSIVGNAFPFYPTQQLGIQSGSSVHFNTGIAIGGVVVANTCQQGSRCDVSIGNQLPVQAIGNQKTLVLLVKFLDSPTADPFTKEQAQGLVFNGQFQNFMKEQSYGKVSFSGDVYGWYTVPRNLNNPICAGVCDFDIGDMVKSYNINPANYSRIIFMLSPEWGLGGYSSVGKARLFINNVRYLLSTAYIATYGFDQPSVWGQQPFKWTNLDFLLSHEIGHSLGVWHANGWDCGTTVIYGECEHIEYGNPFDTMGNYSFSLHFNAFYKKTFGWLSSTDILNINSSGNYSLSALESNTGRRLALVYPFSSAADSISINETVPSYALEWRQPIGFDSRLSSLDLVSNTRGLMVNKVIDNTTTRLVDAEPTNSYWNEDLHQDAALKVGDTFVDMGNGITINPIVTSETSASLFNIKLSTPVCVSQMPSIKGSNFSDDLMVGTPDGYMWINFQNIDSNACSYSEFELVPTLPSGWVVNASIYKKVNVAPSGYGFPYINFTVPSNTSTGDYLISFKVINNKNHISSRVVSGIVHVTKASNSTATIAGPATLTMIYDPSGGENSLISTFNVVVSAGDSDQKISKNNAFSSYVRGSNGSTMGGNTQYTQPAGTTDDGNGYYVIKAGTTANFRVVTMFNPKIMFAGAYYGILDQVTVGDNPNSVSIKISPPNTTNTLVIIGEVSPYINSISPNPIPSNQLVTISGVRFADTGNILTLTNISTGLVNTRSIGSIKDGGVIQFIPNVSEGNYFISVTHPTTGTSNSVFLNVLAPIVISIPTLITSPASSITPTSAVLTGNITSTGNSNPTVRGFNYGLTAAYGSIYRASGDFSTGTYTNNLSSLTCNTTYHYRSYATNSVGTGYGSDSAFTTPACASIVIPPAPIYPIVTPTPTPTPTPTVPITPPSVTVSSPNGGEALTAGSSYTIRWSSNSIPSNASIILKVYNGLSASPTYPNTQLAALSPNTTSYTWTVTSNSGWPVGMSPFLRELSTILGIKSANALSQLANNRYVIGVSVLVNGVEVTNDQSDSTFTIIAPTITNQTSTIWDGIKSFLAVLGF